MIARRLREKIGWWVMGVGFPKQDTLHPRIYRIGARIYNGRWSK